MTENPLYTETVGARNGEKGFGTKDGAFSQAHFLKPLEGRVDLLREAL